MLSLLNVRCMTTFVSQPTVTVFARIITAQSPLKGWLFTMLRKGLFGGGFVTQAHLLVHLSTRL
jgi:hypothetical protein